jgi:hypothetical protein
MTSAQKSAIPTAITTHQPPSMCPQLESASRRALVNPAFIGSHLHLIREKVWECQRPSDD